VLKYFEVLLGFGRVTGALECARHCKFRRSVQRRDGDGQFEDFDFLVELLLFPKADALEIVGVCVSRIELELLAES